MVASPESSIAQSLCAVWDKTLLWDLNHALWGGADSGNANVVYLLGAPWCPFCKRAVREYLEGTFPFELRFVPLDAIQNSHRQQQADIVLNGIDGLRRTFVEKGVKPPSFNPDLQRLIYEANFVAQDGFRRRFPDMKSPTYLYVTSKSATKFTGYKPWPEFTGDLRPYGHEIFNFANELEPILSEIKKLPRGVKANTAYRTAIHALPDSRSASAGCASNRELNVVAEVNFNGVDWLKVEALITHDDEIIHGFVDRRDLKFS
nr:hypothetical protein REQ54_02526 [Rhizobium sp. Q54]